MIQEETNKVKFSVLVPVYNVEKYIDACIQSVLNQTFQDFELILVDDGSKDDSGAICDHYAAKYENIHAYHKENGGQLHTRQFAISRASGEYYVFLDSDDTLRYDALQILAKKFLTYNCDCVIFQLERVCEGKILFRAPQFADVCIEDRRELYKKCFMSNSYNSMCIKAVKATVFQEDVDYSEFYHVRLAEDLLQSLEVIKNSQRVLFVDDVLYNYTVNPNSVTQSVNHKNYRIDFSVRMRVAAFLQESGVFNETDFAVYKGYCAKLFCTEIQRICGFDIPYKQKKLLLDKLRKTAYYQEFLCQGKVEWKNLCSQKQMFWLFRKNCDAILVVGLSAYRCLRNSKTTKKVLRRLKRSFKGKSNG